MRVPVVSASNLVVVIGLEIDRDFAIGRSAHRLKKRAGLRGPAPVVSFWFARLESEAGAELGCESPRQQAARGIDEPNCLGECGILDHVVEVVAVIGMVKEVESLPSELQVAPLAQLDVLGEADVHVEVRVTTQRVIRNDVAAARVVADSFRQA